MSPLRLYFNKEDWHLQNISLNEICMNLLCVNSFPSIHLLSSKKGKKKKEKKEENEGVKLRTCTFIIIL